MSSYCVSRNCPASQCDVTEIKVAAFSEVAAVLSLGHCSFRRYVGWIDDSASYRAKRSRSRHRDNLVFLELETVSFWRT